MITDIQKIHERQSIIVIDDYLSKSELEKFQKYFYEKAEDIFGNEMEKPSSRQWFDCWDKHKFSDICKDLFLLSSQYFDNSKCIGYEFWVKEKIVDQTLGILILMRRQKNLAKHHILHVQ